MSSCLAPGHGLSRVRACRELSGMLAYEDGRTSPLMDAVREAFLK
ncbi:hypothetical protein [Pseudoduganella umbonata]|uniref:Uncharacterized protein n=1 Tax=Pseudoduganella umbonata TaxID=864828 RepID=A0A7W5EDZ5_9BURK|nr:hypothetical protein [Pseudoduganella umbonata]MBB3223371.1 hypothetical protein [Pseudoduganella umbonata]